MSQPTIVCHDATFAWGDGSLLLDHVNVSFGSGRSGLVGDNGSGKTTLLRLILGQLKLLSGSIEVSSSPHYLPQQLTLQTSAPLAEVLGIAAPLDALRAIEAGSTEVSHYEILGDNWDIEARAEALLTAAGMGGIGLDRPVGTLSGGEVTLAALIGLRLAEAPIVLLDEPTNNLDRDSRQRLYQLIEGWRGVLVVVSHDRELLELMDETVELRGASLTVFGGPYSQFQDWLAGEQQAAAQALTSAQQALRGEQRQRQAAETRLAHRSAQGAKAMAEKRAPKIMMNSNKRAAQVSAGRLRETLDDRVAQARDEVEAQQARLRQVKPIRIELPDPGVAAGRRLAVFHSGQNAHIIQGPERVGLVGRNGSGKTWLLRQLVGGIDQAPLIATGDPGMTQAPTVVAGGTEGDQAQWGGTPPGGITPVGAEGQIPLVRVWAEAMVERIGYLPQRADHLDDAASIFDNVAQAAPAALPGEIRSQLARFLFRGNEVNRLVGSLSGGERFRVSLARILLATPPNQLLILDEPTNNLDLTSVTELVDALSGYRGGLIVVSHDDHFLDQLGLDYRLYLGGDGLQRQG